MYKCAPPMGMNYSLCGDYELGLRVGVVISPMVFDQGLFCYSNFNIH